MESVDPWLAVLAAGSALFISALVWWRAVRIPRAIRRHRPLTRDNGETREVRTFPPADPEPALPTPERLLFAADAAGLSRQACRRLDTAAALLASRPEVRLVLEGSADSLGDPLRNRALTEARASVARTYLLAHGADTSRVSVRNLTPRPGRTEAERQDLRCVRLVWSNL